MATYGIVDYLNS